MIFKRKLLLLFFCFLFFNFHDSFAQQWLWGNEAIPESLNAGGDPYGGDHCIAVDKAGNVYFAGNFDDTIAFTNYTLRTTTDDVCLVKYNASGKIIWVKEATIPRRECYGYATAIALDSHDNVYLTGHFNGAISFASFMLNSYYDVFLAKYDSSGNVLWAKQAISSNNYSCYGTSVAVDTQGNAYISGGFQESVTFGTYTLNSIGYFGDLFLVKYNSGGNVLWAKQSNSISSDCEALGNSLAIDVSGNVYLTGYFHDTTVIGKYTLETKLNSFDVFLAKYDSGGNVLWATQASPSSYGQANSVAVDGAGNAYITGYFWGLLSLGASNLSNGNGYYDVFLAKFNSSGNALWAEKGGSLDNSNWYGWSVACDTLNRGGGYLIMSSWFEGKGLVFGTDTFKLNDSNPDAETIFLRFDSSGKVKYGNAFTEGTEDDYDGVAVDHSGKYIYIAGDLANIYNDTIVFGKDTLPAYPLSSGQEILFISRWGVARELNFSATVTGTTTCKFNCTGMAMASALGGIPPYTYLWNTGQTTRTITGLCAGTYSVIVTDSAGYATTQTTNVSAVVDSIRGYVTPQDTQIFQGQSIVLSAGGGQFYNWQPPSGLSCTTCPNPTASPLVNSIYTLVISDTNGCSITYDLTVNLETRCGNFFIPDVFSPAASVNNILFARCPCFLKGEFMVFRPLG